MTIALNRPAVTSLAYYGDISRLQSLYKETRRTMRRLELGPFDTPSDSTAPVLDRVNPYSNYPSTLDILTWLNSLTDAMSSDSDSGSDSDDDSVDDIEFLTRLYATLDARINPAYKSALIEDED